MRRFLPVFMCAALLAACSLSGGGTTTKDDSESLVTVTSLTDASGTASVIESDLASSQSDQAKVTFQNQTKSVSITSPSPFFGVTLTRYRVVYSRADGGPAPAPFEAAMSLLVPAPATAMGVTTPGTASTSIVVVPFSVKAAPPLTGLSSGESLAASATITFEGQDGLGRRLSTTGGIAVIFRRS